MKAVANFYGFLDNPYSDVSMQLDPLMVSGDKTAAMWKAVFLSMGYGGYKRDESQGYTIGKTCRFLIENNARNGDAEALNLLFYACQMGLEGDDAKPFATNFLEKAANADFKPAIYDYARQYNMRKNYVYAMNYFQKRYNMDVNKSREFIGKGSSYTAPENGILNMAINDADYTNNRGYFDLVVEVPQK